MEEQDPEIKPDGRDAEFDGRKIGESADKGKNADQLMGESFNKRFEQGIKEVESPEVGKIKTIDISPEVSKETPQKGVIFLAPGWLETLAGNKYLIYQLVVNGYRVISLEHPRSGGTEKSSEKRRNAAIGTVVDCIRGEKMTVVAHSLGAIDMAKFAADSDRDQVFGNFILVNPAGLEDESRLGVAKLLGLGKNYLGHMGNPAPRSPISEDVRKAVGAIGMKDLGKSPSLALQEGLQVAFTNIKPGLAQLRKKGHKVVVMAQEDDRLFPPKGEGVAGHVDEHLVLPGDHNTARTIDPGDPDQQILGTWIDLAIQHLNKGVK